MKLQNGAIEHNTKTALTPTKFVLDKMAGNAKHGGSSTVSAGGGSGWKNQRMGGSVPGAGGDNVTTQLTDSSNIRDRSNIRTPFSNNMKSM